MNKLSFLNRLKRAGVFQLTQPFVRNKLLILCYHAFELKDECQFRSSLFIRQSTFRKRMELLLSAGYRVLPLDEAISQLQANQLQGLNAVITIDDGFHSVHQLAYPILKAFNLPATVYITSYFQQKQTPVFGLAIQYMFWRSNHRPLDLAPIKQLIGDDAETLSSDRNILMDQLIKLGTLANDNDFREALADVTGHALGENYQKIRDDRLFTIMSDEQLADNLDGLIDLQLHTHRHQLPGSCEATIQEIKENRIALERIRAGQYQHFCYPSGEWGRQYWPWLEKAGITTATTCESGFATHNSPLLALDRLLDGENLSAIQFEAELYGLGEISRIFKRLIKRA